jgi:hypothetical protein
MIDGHEINKQININHVMIPSDKRGYCKDGQRPSILSTNYTNQE